jgi:hypothetical protein
VVYEQKNSLHPVYIESMSLNCPCFLDDNLAFSAVVVVLDSRDI